MPKAGSSSHINHDYNESSIDRMKYMVGEAVTANQNVREKDQALAQNNSVI